LQRQNDVVSSHSPPAWRTDLFETDEPTEHTVPKMKAEKKKLAMWVTVETLEVIELKRTVIDRDVAEAVKFFQAVIAPQVRAMAGRYGIHRVDIEETDDGHLSG